MGLFRKTMSLSSLGMVSYRSKDERNLRAVKQTAKYSKQARNAARANVAQNALDLQLQREQLEYAQQQAGIAQAQLEEQVAQRQGQQGVRVVQRRRQIERQEIQRPSAQQQSRATQAQVENRMNAQETQEIRQRTQRLTSNESNLPAGTFTGPEPSHGVVAPPSKPAGWYPVPGDPGALIWWDSHAFHPETLHYRERPSS